LAAPNPGKYWLIGGDQEIAEWDLVLKDGKWAGEIAARFPLMMASTNQAALTAIATDGRGRAAAYCGKRIQFFAAEKMAARNSSILANGGDGNFKDLFWDQPGHLIVAAFRQPGGLLRMESWQTSGSFPPDVRPLPTLSLDCDSAEPANDGWTLIVRGERQGLWRINPATGASSAIDMSDSARQNAPFVCAADGSLLAMVVDHTGIRLLAMPSGANFADLQSPRAAALTALAWDASGRHLASITEDGYVQVWDLAPWQEWLARHGLQKNK
jgi:hypothetical protein